MTVTQPLPNTREDSQEISGGLVPANTSTAVAEQVRRMRSAGHGLHDIASTLRVHPEQVRRWLTVLDQGAAAAAHAQAWRPRS